MISKIAIFIYGILLCVELAGAYADHRMSSRTVKIKYGSLRGYLVNFPSKNLKTVEVFLGNRIVYY